MKQHNSLYRMVLLGLLLSLAGVVYAQRTINRKLIVNGKTVSAAVVQLNGHFYLDVETLAQITNGAVTVDPNQIALTIPNSNADATIPQPAPGLSKEFASAALESVAEMKEWKGALATMVTYGLAVDGTWAQTYQDRVHTSLGQATVAASTNSDHSALRLLNAEYTNLANWATGVMAERQALNGARTVDPNSLQNDPQLTKITNCGRFLNSMLVSRAFAENANCN
jgi:hypothetical protein